MPSLLILGAGGHARVLAETALAQGIFNNIAFLDDSLCHTSSSDGASVLNFPVLGPLSFCLNLACCRDFPSAIVGIGNAQTRLRWLDHLSSWGYNLPVLVHPTAWVSPSAHLGPGSAVCAHSVVQTQSCIKRGVILNTSCTIDHNVHLQQGVHICPGAHLAGDVRVGERSWIGIGASVIQQIQIGSDVTIGAGAAVTSNIPDGVTAVGVPARLL